MTTKRTLKQPQESLDQDTASIIDPAPTHDALGIIASSANTANNGRMNLALALVKAQAECQNVVMNRINPHFKSRYADFAAVRDAVVPIFTKHGLAILQVPHHDGFNGFGLETRLVHESGEQMVWMYPLPQDVSKPQAQGSAISYAKRYTMSSLAAIASEEDDDANAAQNSNGGGRAGGGGANAGASAGGNTPGAAGGIVL